MKNPFSLIAGAWNALKSRSSEYRTRYQYLGLNNAAVHVNHDIAMQVSAVWGCMDVIASALASTDWNVYAGVQGLDNKKALPEDNLQYILNSRFNREMTAQSGKRALVLAAVGFGNGMAEIERDMAGRITGLWPIDPRRIELRRDAETLELFYRVFQTSNGSFVDLAPSDVFHIRGSGLTGFAGDDPVGRAIQSIASAVAIEQFAGSYFANNAQPGIILESPNLARMDDTTKNRIRESFEERHQGARKSFRVGFAEGGMKIHQLNVDADKAQLIEAKQATVEDIARFFHVPPHKIQQLTNSTNNNIEHQGLEFSRDTIRPWKTEIEQECAWSLLPARGQKKFIELDVDWMEQGDYNTRATAYSTYRGCGVFSVNDVLRKLGENTIGKEGDIRTMNGASVKLEDVGKNMLPAALPAPKPEPKPAKSPQNSDKVLRDWAESIYSSMNKRYLDRIKKNSTRSNPMPELARKDAEEYLALKWNDIAASIESERPDISYAKAMQIGISVIEGKSTSEAVNELFKRNSV